MVASHLEVRKEPKDCDCIMSTENLGSYLDVQLIPLLIESLRGTCDVTGVAAF